MGTGEDSDKGGTEKERNRGNGRRRLFFKRTPQLRVGRWELWRLCSHLLRVLCGVSILAASANVPIP